MATETLPYPFAAAQSILRDIGECSCNDCIKFYLLEFKGGALTSTRDMRGLRLLARENCYTGAVNFNLDMAGV